MRGGSLLGQGVYGCTFEPAPRCAGGQVFRRVGDLTAVGKVTVEDTADELSIGRAIMALPLAANYFALPTTRCRPDPAAIKEDPDAGSCKVLEDSEGKDSSLSMLVMPAAGVQILKWSSRLDRLAANYVDVFAHLLEGIIIYQDAGFVHNDIHMGNVLVDERGTARFIDFGIAFRPADVKAWEDSNLSTRFRPNFVWQAPEVHGWRMRLNGIRITDGAEQLLSQNDEWRRIQNQFPARPTLVRALTEFLAAETDGVEMLRRYATGFDCWRIGLLFWLMWDDLTVWSQFPQTPLWAQRDLVRQVLGGLTEFDPRRRWSARKALAALDPTNRLLARPLTAAPTTTASR
jgi:hypothetical protein